ncbi:MAG: hypothetical protein VXZ82_01960 [Planctomycetota bacterium]|nr:hypothetical protein [Planctomycetota bacterium]
MLKIDVDEMTNGQAVATELGGGGEGLPWMTILDSTGKELVNSVGPTGNIGCPVGDEERAHFLAMLGKTIQRATPEELKQIEANLAAYANKLR